MCSEWVSVVMRKYPITVLGSTTESTETGLRPYSGPMVFETQPVAPEG